MANHDSLEPSAHRLLLQALQHTLCTEFPMAKPRLFHRDYNKQDLFVRFAGCALAREELRARHRDGGKYPPILMIGLFSPARNTDHLSAGEQELAALLRWKGFAYLQLGFTSVELIVAAAKAIEGTKGPPPAEDILAGAGDVLRSLSGVRHWLESRQRNVRGSLRDFEAAVRGEQTLHESYLEPVIAISDEHRDMLNRLFELETAVMRMAPQVGGLEPVRTVLNQFEAEWREMEKDRAALRAEADQNKRAKRWEAIKNGLFRVCEAISGAIAAMRKLESELSARQEN